MARPPSGESRELKVVTDNITLLMERKGWMQKDLSEATGITAASVSNYLSGKVKPTVEVLMRIAEAFDVPVVRLFTASEGAAEKLHNQYVRPSELSIKQTLDNLAEQTKWVSHAPPEALELLKGMKARDWEFLLPMLRTIARNFPEETAASSDNARKAVGVKRKA